MQVTPALAAVLAHQGGWDEMLMVLVPVLLFVGLLWLANRRAEQQQHEQELTQQDDRGRPEGEGPSEEGGGRRD